MQCFAFGIKSLPMSFVNGPGFGIHNCTGGLNELSLEDIITLDDANFSQGLQHLVREKHINFPELSPLQGLNLDKFRSIVVFSNVTSLHR
jgi:hypothetical protein